MVGERRGRKPARNLKTFRLFKTADRPISKKLSDGARSHYLGMFVLHYIEASDPLASLRRIIHVADGIVATNWSGIGRLGRELLDRRLIGQDELIDWFERHPAVRCDTALTP